MRKFDLLVPVTTLINGRYWSDVIDTFTYNYSVKRDDSYTLVQRYKDLTGVDLSSVAVNTAGRCKYVTIRDTLLDNTDYDATVLAALSTIATTGTEVYVEPTHYSLADTISLASNNSLTGIIATSSGQVTTIRAAGLKAVSYGYGGFVVDVCIYDTASVTTNATAVSAMASITSSGAAVVIAREEYAGTRFDDAMYVKAMAIGADGFGYDESNDQMDISDYVIAPKVFMGTTQVPADNGTPFSEEIADFNVSTDYWVFPTDIGKVLTDSTGSFFLVRNELGRVVEHGLTSVETLSVETSNDVNELDDNITVPIEYSNEIELDRYVRFSCMASDETPILHITISPDADTINQSATYDIVDPLPGWMAWKTDTGSIAWKFTNAIGAVIDDLVDQASSVALSSVQAFPVTEVNGFGLKYWVGESYYPDPIEWSDEDAVIAAQASDIRELMLSSEPAYAIMGEWIISVNGADDSGLFGEETNLWTPLDEWGLLLGLHRHDGETLTRFRARILDIGLSPANATESGLENALFRELMPPDTTDVDNFVRTGNISIYRIDSRHLNDDEGFPTDTKLRAVTEQREHGVHTWNNARIGRAIWNADGPEHEAMDRLPYRSDTDLTQFAGLTASGVGPGDDLSLIEATEADLSATVTLIRESLGYTDTAATHPADVTFKLWAEGDTDTLVKPLVRYRLEVKVRRTTDNKEFSRFILGESRSNILVNGTLRPINTRIEQYGLLNSDGTLRGIWHDETGNHSVLNSDLPLIADCNRITVDVSEIYVVTDTTTKITTGTLYGGERYVRFSLEERPDEASAGNWTSEGTQLEKTTTLSYWHTLSVQVAPLTTSNSAIVADTWVGPSIILEERINNDWDGSTYSNLNRIIPIPAYNIPSNVSGTTWFVEPISISFPLRLDASAQEILTAFNTVVVEFATSGGSPSGGATSDLGGTPNIYVHAHDEPAIKTPDVHIVSGNVNVELGVGESTTHLFSEFALTSLATTDTNVTYSGSVGAGFIMSIDEDNESVTVTRARSVIDREFLAHHGTYWIGKDESYFYVSPVVGSISVSETTKALAGIPADFSAVWVDGYQYRFVDDAGNKSFSVTMSILGSGTANLYVPDTDIENVVVLDDATPLTVSSVSDNKIILSAVTDMTKTYTVSYDLAHSFYVSGQTIYLSEATTGSTAYSYQPIGSSYAQTGINISPMSTWDRRFFVGYDGESAATPTTLTVNPHRQQIIPGTLQGGLIDTVLIEAITLDSDGNPVSGRTIVWTCDVGDLYYEQTTTNSEGRATAYFCASAVQNQIATITAHDHAADLTTNTEVSVLDIDGATGVDWTLVVDHSSLVRAGTTMRMLARAWTPSVVIDSATIRIDYVPASENGTLTTNATITDDSSIAYSNIDGSGNITWTEAVGNTVTAAGENNIFDITHLAYSRTGTTIEKGLYRMTITPSAPANCPPKYIIWRVY
jgi:hypothetical protein